MFASFFGSIYNKNTSPNENLYPLASNVRSETLNSINVRKEDKELIIKNLDPNKGSGPDQIPNIFLFNTYKSISVPLNIIFNRSLTESIFPKQFKNSNVTPIFKNGDKSDVTNYRPICLSNAISKIFERIVHTHLYKYLEREIDMKQHGFMSNKSTLTNTMIYSDYISRTLDEGGELHAIYTDFSKAFDSVNFEILLAKLGSYGIQGNLINWIRDYLTNRTLRVIFVGGKSFEFVPNAGVPQGSILGALLFNVFINDLGSLLNCEYLLYADDLKLYRKITNHNDILCLQGNIDILDDWCSKNKISLNISKCKFISFTLKHHGFDGEYYTIQGKKLEKVKCIKDLGILFDTKLKFEEHIKHITSKANRMLGFITRITKKFSNINCFHILYNSLVRPQLEYSSPVWSPYQKEFVDKIERIQKKYTRIYYYRERYEYQSYDQRLLRLEMPSLSYRISISICVPSTMLFITII